MSLSDTEVIEWLERNLRSMSHDRQTCSVDMSGNRITMQVDVDHVRGLIRRMRRIILGNIM